jgi:hypothetical protein
MEQPVPDGFSTESFSGFYLSDHEIPDGPYRPVAIEIKHLFESLLKEADDVNEEIFLDANLKSALEAFVRRPDNVSLCFLLAAGPSLYESILEIVLLVAPSLLNEVPVVIS